MINDYKQKQEKYLKCPKSRKIKSLERKIGICQAIIMTSINYD